MPTQSPPGAADTVYAGGGNDSIRGFIGNDILYGEDGNDTIYGGGYIDGGSGNDYISTGTYIGLAGYGDMSDTVFGGTGNDTITTRNGYEHLYGGDGVDLFIFDDADIINGIVYGGNHADTFRFAWFARGDVYIEDFSVADGDKIQIDDIVEAVFTTTWTATNVTEGTLITLTQTDGTSTYTGDITIVGIYDLPTTSIEII